MKATPVRCARKYSPMRYEALAIYSPRLCFYNLAEHSDREYVRFSPVEDYVYGF